MASALQANCKMEPVPHNNISETQAGKAQYKVNHQQGVGQKANDRLSELHEKIHLGAWTFSVEF